MCPSRRTMLAVDWDSWKGLFGMCPVLEVGESGNLPEESVELGSCPPNGYSSSGSMPHKTGWMVGEDLRRIPNVQG